MKKSHKLLIISVCVITLLGSGTLVAKAFFQKDTSDPLKRKNIESKPVEVTTPSSFNYNGTEYELKTEDQKEFYLQNSDSTNVNVKAILKYIGVLQQEDKAYTLKEVEEVLSKLDKSAGAYEVAKALDTLAGACDCYGGSGWLQYHYSLANSSGITENMGGQTVYTETIDGKPVFRTIWHSGLGFKAEGWSTEEINQYNIDRKKAK